MSRKWSGPRPESRSSQTSSGSIRLTKCSPGRRLEVVSLLFPRTKEREFYRSVAYKKTARQRKTVDQKCRRVVTGPMHCSRVTGISF